MNERAMKAETRAECFMGLLKKDPYTTKKRGGQTRKGRTRFPDGVKPTFFRKK
jgi:hypothetical protein